MITKELWVQDKFFHLFAFFFREMSEGELAHAISRATHARRFIPDHDVLRHVPEGGRSLSVRLRHLAEQVGRISATQTDVRNLDLPRLLCERPDLGSRTYVVGGVKQLSCKTIQKGYGHWSSMF